MKSIEGAAYRCEKTQAGAREDGDHNTAKMKASRGRRMALLPALPRKVEAGKFFIAVAFSVMSKMSRNFVPHISPSLCVSYTQPDPINIMIDEVMDSLSDRLTGQNG